ncbi:MAG TPA: ATP-binding protein [Thermomicrobiales bacterium]|jgi:signal transduction histidine kinase|nr:hypothetical protein [Chloroflexota bacterium]HCG30648.1 hypothetical protein [Chloroflexota bacterium]HQZ90916.1 ATP-binding protein [Thermomicrobiales bacterium]HRA32389.1 ATP-binding protein [Thermomicrobiales bacterium]
MNHTGLPASSAGDPIYHLATALLATETVDEALSAALPLLGTALDTDRGIRIDLSHDLTPALTPGFAIPLIAKGRAIGAIVVDGDALDPERASAVAGLLATAIATRRHAAVENERLLQEASGLKMDVVSMLSHEMRTPLASIKGYASALRIEGIGWDAGTRGDFLQTIEEETDRLTHLVEDILESAAIDAGLLRLQPEPILISRIARRVIDRISIQTNRHRFVAMFSSNFPVIEADSQRIEQVLTNLIDNAVKYSPDGGLVVVRGEVRASEVVISVVDQGTGIAPEHLNKLFERFFRASPEHRQHIVGTGLGLPISESLVRAHGGRIWAESAVGRGTTLSFTVPIHGAAERDV